MAGALFLKPHFEEKIEENLKVTCLRKSQRNRGKY